MWNKTTRVIPVVTRVLGSIPHSSKNYFKNIGISPNIATLLPHWEQHTFCDVCSLCEVKDLIDSTIMTHCQPATRLNETR